jgi:hypothetical protein
MQQHARCESKDFQFLLSPQVKVMLGKIKKTQVFASSSYHFWQEACE